MRFACTVVDMVQFPFLIYVSEMDFTLT
jgi:hypothetical protein